MAAVNELMLANLLEVFNERDDDRRGAAIARTYAADVTFSDPEDVITGRDTLSAKAKKLLDGAPTFVFSAAGSVLVNHNLGYLAWNLGPAGQAPVVRGMDIALVEDGLIETLYTLLLTD